MKGDAFHVVDYKIQLDFADTDGGFDNKLLQSVAFKDVYITVKELPYLGHVRMGHFKEPFGLEQLTSARFITFMERSLADEGAIVPARRMGVMAFDNWADDRGTWAVGAFTGQMLNGSEPPIFQGDDGGTAVTMRGTFLPWYDEGSGGRGLLHTGIAYSYRNLSEPNALRLRQRPEAHLAPRIVDTRPRHAGPRGAEDGPGNGLRLRAPLDPVRVLRRFRSAQRIRHGRLNGYYVYASYFLTGEHRRYKKSSGAFDRVKPFTNFFRVRTGDGVQTGWGAWELAYRYSSLDLHAPYAGIDGGFADDHTFGVNWYLNPYTRLMFNYVLSASTPSGAQTAVTDMSVYQMRCQIDF